MDKDTKAKLQAGLNELQKLQNTEGEKIFSSEDFNKYLKQHVAEACKNMIKDGELAYVLVAVLKHRKTNAIEFAVIVFADWPPPEELDGKPFGKEGAMLAIGVKLATDKQLAEYRVVAAYTIAEAWTVSAHPEDYHTGNLKAPSENPDREECVVVYGETIDRRSAIYMGAIVRDKNNHEKVVAVKEQLFNLHDPNEPLDPEDSQTDANGIRLMFKGYIEAVAKGKNSK